MSEELEREVAVNEEETPEYAPPLLQSIQDAAPMLDVTCITGH
jgi:hypothetical protein